MKPTRSVFILIEDIYRTVGHDGSWAAVLRSLQGNLRSSAAALAAYDFAVCAGALRHAVGIAEEHRGSYAAFAPHSPWLRREECYRREGSVWIGRELTQHRDLVTSEFYQNWLKPQNLFHAAVAVLRWRGSETLYVTALRPPNAGPFEHRELELFDLLIPHLRQAFELSERFAGARADTHQTLETVLEETPGALLLLDEDERLLGVSREGERLLASGAPFRTRGRRVGLAQSSGRGAFHRQVSAALRTASGEDLVPGRQMTLRSDHEMAANIVPLPKGTLPGQDRPAVAVVVDDPLPGEDRLRELHGLTPAEARVAALLARGLSAQEAAERLNIGITTARTHLQRIYGKTETRRQSELVALLLGAAKRSSTG